MMNLKKSYFAVFKRSVKNKFDGRNLIKCDILKGRLPKYFFLEIGSSGGRHTIHKASAASIIKTRHLRTSLKCFRVQRSKFQKVCRCQLSSLYDSNRYVLNTLVA